MLYKIFIDDSGSKDYISPYSRDFIDNPPGFDNYQKFWRDNYFVLCGVRQKIAIKVVDFFGNDTMKVVEVNV